MAGSGQFPKVSGDKIYAGDTVGKQTGDLIRYSDFGLSSSRLNTRVLNTDWRRTWYLGPMTGIYSSSTNADDSYFGGSIPSNSTWYTRLSNYFYTFTTPNTIFSYNLRLSSWGCYIGCGYQYDDGGPYSGSTYWYDRMRLPGISVYTLAGAYVGGNTTTNTADQTYLTNGGSAEYRGIDTLVLPVLPNTTYKIYYRCDFYRQTPGEYSFYFANSGTPTVSLTNY